MAFGLLWLHTKLPLHWRKPENRSLLTLKNSWPIKEVKYNNWMAWCKTNVSDFFRWNFFSSKLPEFLHVLFNLVVIHLLTKEKQTEGGKNRGKIQDLNQHSKKNYPPHTHAFITCTMLNKHVLTKELKI